MAEILVLGAGLNGLSTALLLARDGHTVTVVERDSHGPPSDPEVAWDTWERRGVNQFRMLHFLLPRWRAVMEVELPQVVDELEAQGGVRVNVLDWWLTDHSTRQAAERLPEDERFDALTARRPVIESAVAAVVERRAGIVVRRGVAVSGLLVTGEDGPGVPRVGGVLTEGGGAIRADLIVDACGRRSALPAWLAAAGADRPAEEIEDSGFVYYARHFHSADGSPDPTGQLIQFYDSVSLLVLPADRGTWGVGVITSARDRDLRKLRDPEVWHRVVSRYPHAAPWAAAEPISKVDVITKIEDRIRSLVVDDRPVATGVVAVGDAWACTNPSIGRGATIGLLHACSLRNVLREADAGAADSDGAEKLVRRFAEATAAQIEPLYRDTLAFDRHRLAEIDADIAGTDYTPEDPQWAFTKAIMAAAPDDPEVARGAAAINSLLETPDEVLRRPGLMDRIIEKAATAAQYPLEGPTRSELLAAVNG